MKKYLLSLLVLLSLVRASSAIADRTKMVTVTNSTSYTLSEVYASASVNDAWDKTTNLLAGHTVAPGQTATITIADGLDHCHYDLMAVLYGSAEYGYQYYVNTCESSAQWNITQSQ